MTCEAYVVSQLKAANKALKAADDSLGIWKGVAMRSLENFDRLLTILSKHIDKKDERYIAFRLIFSEYDKEDYDFLMEQLKLKEEQADES